MKYDFEPVEGKAHTFRVIDKVSREPVNICIEIAEAYAKQGGKKK